MTCKRNAWQSFIQTICIAPHQDIQPVASLARRICRLRMRPFQIDGPTTARPETALLMCMQQEQPQVNLWPQPSQTRTVLQNRMTSVTNKECSYDGRTEQCSQLLYTNGIFSVWQHIYSLCTITQFPELCHLQSRDSILCYHQAVVNRSGIVNLFYLMCHKIVLKDFDWKISRAINITGPINTE